MFAHLDTSSSRFMPSQRVISSATFSFTAGGGNFHALQRVKLRRRITGSSACYYFVGLTFGLPVPRTSNNRPSVGWLNLGDLEEQTITCVSGTSYNILSSVRPCTDIILIYASNLLLTRIATPTFELKYVNFLYFTDIKRD